MKPETAADELTGEDVRTMRAAAGLSQSELARALSVHVTTVSKWERGVFRVTPLAARALRAFFADLKSAAPSAELATAAG